MEGENGIPRKELEFKITRLERKITEMNQDEDRMRERCLDKAIGLSPRRTLVGEANQESDEQILDRAEQFYQFVKKK
jgi:predicted DNA-binding helix-hairpin-helix protein